MARKRSTHDFAMKMPSDAAMSLDDARVLTSSLFGVNVEFTGECVMMEPGSALAEMATQWVQLKGVEVEFARSFLLAIFQPEFVSLAKFEMLAESFDLQPWLPCLEKKYQVYLKVEHDVGIVRICGAEEHVAFASSSLSELEECFERTLTVDALPATDISELQRLIAMELVGHPELTMESVKAFRIPVLDILLKWLRWLNGKDDHGQQIYSSASSMPLAKTALSVQPHTNTQSRHRESKRNLSETRADKSVPCASKRKNTGSPDSDDADCEIVEIWRGKTPSTKAPTNTTGSVEQMNHALNKFSFALPASSTEAIMKAEKKILAQQATGNKSPISGQPTASSGKPVKDVSISASQRSATRNKISNAQTATELPAATNVASTTLGCVVTTSVTVAGSARTTSTTVASPTATITTATVSDKIPGSLPAVTANQRFLRPIVVDGQNVAWAHGGSGQGKCFSARGLLICAKYFRDKGHKVTIFLPANIQNRRPPEYKDMDILPKLEQINVLQYIQGRKIVEENRTRRINPHDDYCIVEAAHRTEAILITNDNLRDCAEKNPQWKATIRDRILLFHFHDDEFIPAFEPLGRGGPTLEEFLRFPVGFQPPEEKSNEALIASLAQSLNVPVPTNDPPPGRSERMQMRDQFSHNHRFTRTPQLHNYQRMNRQQHFAQPQFAEPSFRLPKSSTPAEVEGTSGSSFGSFGSTGPQPSFCNPVPGLLSQRDDHQQEIATEFVLQEQARQNSFVSGSNRRPLLGDGPHHGTPVADDGTPFDVHMATPSSSNARCTSVDEGFVSPTMARTVVETQQLCHTLEDVFTTEHSVEIQDVLMQFPDNRDINFLALRVERYLHERQPPMDIVSSALSTRQGTSGEKADDDLIEFEDSKTISSEEKLLIDFE